MGADAQSQPQVQQLEGGSVFTISHPGLFLTSPQNEQGSMTDHSPQHWAMPATDSPRPATVVHIC